MHYCANRPHFDHSSISWWTPPPEIPQNLAESLLLFCRVGTILNQLLLTYHCAHRLTGLSIRTRGASVCRDSGFTERQRMNAWGCSALTGIWTLRPPSETQKSLCKRERWWMTRTKGVACGHRTAPHLNSQLLWQDAQYLWKYNGKFKCRERGWVHNSTLSQGAIGKQVCLEVWGQSQMGSLECHLLFLTNDWGNVSQCSGSY